jgi:HEAT repeats/PBS lyase HEAT-like repeat
MSENIEKIPLDARLLSDAIIELNISRRNVSVYPQNHPSVERSLSRAFELMQKLFELRPEITLAVAKDTLIIDDYYLEKKNPVYREFALQLSNMNIAYITFITGLTKEELYEFHRFISAKFSDLSSEPLQEKFRELNLIHIKTGFIDYGAFAFDEGKTQKEPPKEQLWERYVYGMLEGTLQPDGISEEIREIPPELLARFLNKSSTSDLKEESYDKVITSYIRRSSESAFSSTDLRRLLDFINGLKPELKKQFLSSTVRTVSQDMDAAYKALSGVSVDEIMELLSTINAQKMVIPEALKNLLDKLSNLPQVGTQDVKFGDSMLVDDIFLSPDIVNLLGEGDFKSYIDDTYQKDIQKLLDFKSGAIPIRLKELEREFSDDIIEKDFNQTILELLPLSIITEEEYQSFLTVIKDQIDQFIWTGQYGQLLKILHVLTSNAEKSIFPDVTSEAIRGYYSQEFIGNLIESFKILGRQMREEAWMLCEYYGDRIISPLIDALIKEDSQVVRRFFVGILKQFGNRIIPEAIKRLGDSRWFVKRNMLYILGECNSEEVLPYIRPYCRHENLKVSFEAVKCLLNAGDAYGIAAVRDYLLSEYRETVELGVALAGTYKIREVISELIQMLKKRGIGGAELYNKIPIIKALGEIGDPRALEPFRELLSGKSILFKGVTEKLKEEIYRTLKNYPSQDIRDLVEAGLKSKNEYIREEALRLSGVVEE